MVVGGSRWVAYTSTPTTVGKRFPLFKKSNPLWWILLIDFQKNPDVGAKTVSYCSHKEVLCANFRPVVREIAC
jgi:hypothetical protein